MKKIIRIISVIMVFFVVVNHVGASVQSGSRSWNLYYSNASTGSHMTDSFSLPVSTQYEFSTTEASGQAQKVKINFNGVIDYVYCSNTSTKYFFYNGTERPNVKLTLSVNAYGQGTAMHKGTVTWV